MDEQDPKKQLHLVDGIEHAEQSGDKDWNRDSFPTSAKPIFRAGVLLVLIVVLLCFVTYSCSVHEDDEPKAAKPAPENPLGDSEF